MALILAPYNNAMRLGQGFNTHTQKICIDDAVVIDPARPENVLTNDGTTMRIMPEIVQDSKARETAEPLAKAESADDAGTRALSHEIDGSKREGDSPQIVPVGDQEGKSTDRKEDQEGEKSKDVESKDGKLEAETPKVEKPKEDKPKDERPEERSVEQTHEAENPAQKAGHGGKTGVGKPAVQKTIGPKKGSDALSHGTKKEGAGEVDEERDRLREQQDERKAREKERRAEQAERRAEQVQNRKEAQQERAQDRAQARADEKEALQELKASKAEQKANVDAALSNKSMSKEDKDAIQAKYDKIKEELDKAFQDRFQGIGVNQEDLEFDNSTIGGPSQIVTYTSRFVDKLSDITEDMNISGSFSIKAGKFGGSARGSFVDSGQI